MVLEYESFQYQSLDMVQFQDYLDCDDWVVLNTKNLILKKLLSQLIDLQFDDHANFKLIETKN